MIALILCINVTTDTDNETWQYLLGESYPFCGYYFTDITTLGTLLKFYIKKKKNVSWFFGKAKHKIEFSGWNSYLEMVPFHYSTVKGYQLEFDSDVDSPYLRR